MNLVLLSWLTGDFRLGYYMFDLLGDHLTARFCMRNVRVILTQGVSGLGLRQKYAIALLKVCRLILLKNCTVWCEKAPMGCVAGAGGVPADHCGVTMGVGDGDKELTLPVPRGVGRWYATG